MCGIRPWKCRSPGLVRGLRLALAEILPETLGRPLAPSCLLEHESKKAIQTATRLGSPEFLDLHSDRGDGVLRNLKIAAGVHVHATEAEIHGKRLTGQFLVRDGIIQAASIEGAHTGGLGQGDGLFGGGEVIGADKYV